MRQHFFSSVTCWTGGGINNEQNKVQWDRYIRKVTMGDNSSTSVTKENKYQIKGIAFLERLYDLTLIFVKKREEIIEGITLVHKLKS